MAPRALAATAATTVAILSAVAALLAHLPVPASASTTASSTARLKADEAMRAISAGPLRQPWRPGASLLAERRPQLFSTRGSALATLPCFAWNVSSLAARGADVWLGGWRALPDPEWGAAARPTCPCVQASHSRPSTALGGPRRLDAEGRLQWPSEAPIPLSSAEQVRRSSC